MWKEELAKQFGFDGIDGTYVFHLGRVKEARQVGTLTINDFTEVDHEDEWYLELESLIQEEIRKAYQSGQENGIKRGKEKLNQLIDDIPSHITKTYAKGNTNL